MIMSTVCTIENLQENFESVLHLEGKIPSYYTSLESKKIMYAPQT